MKVRKLFYVVLGLIFTISTTAQKTPLKNKTLDQASKKAGSPSKISILAGFGVASYFGDLLQYNRFFSQASYAFSAGASYAFDNHFSAGVYVGLQKVKAADNKNRGTQYKERNLSFRSSIFDVSASAECNLLNMKNYPLSPYISAGIGVMFFNPYTNDASGKKQYLRELGTEGQGLSAYPNRKIYRKNAVQFPLGFGFKYAAGKKIILQLDFNYRITGTDYLDDVSINSYPDKVLLDARNPTTAKFTWRGNEVGGEAYPKNLSLPRGNPDDKDGYYTTQLKVAFKL